MRLLSEASFFRIKVPPLVELAIVEEALEILNSPFEACVHHPVEFGADLFLSSQDHPPDFLAKANLSDLGSKGDNPIPRAPLPLPKPQGEVTQLVHPLLLTLGMDTSILSQPFPYAGPLQYFLTSWRLPTQDQFILNMTEGVLMPFVETLQQARVPPQTFHHQPERQAIGQEIAEMLQEGEVQVVFPLKGEFISTVFLVKKKDGDQQ